MINFREEIIKILDEKIDGLDAKEIDKMIEVPPNYELGDFAFPVFSLAKIYRKKSCYDCRRTGRTNRFKIF